MLCDEQRLESGLRWVGEALSDANPASLSDRAASTLAAWLEIMGIASRLPR